MDRRQLLAHLGLAGASGLAALSRPGAARAQLFGAPAADLWPRWQAHDPASAATIDHEPWTALLRRHVSEGPDGINRVAYGRWQTADRDSLAAYLDRLAGIAIGTHNRAEQFAYWVNLYNALTIRVVLDHYPVASIRDIDISPGLFASGPWGAELIAVEGQALTLDDIEHRILRPIWRDPRIHYAVNCASLGCPDLRRTAFTGAGLDAALDDAARTYVNHPRGARVRDGRLVASRIYDWFQADFGGSDSGVIAHLRRHADPALSESLAGITAIADHRYDWALNDTADPA
ncbi:MAG: DUF547 domain-containing protein [Alphaproteobacteria bacterium]|jgi:hypothetical protein|nr:DUF547 domain-containing protein [Alphaproteobacteria bacterium]